MLKGVNDMIKLDEESVGDNKFETTDQNEQNTSYDHDLRDSNVKIEIQGGQTPQEKNSEQKLETIDSKIKSEIPHPNTLKESICSTLSRDLLIIFHKLKFVLNPFTKSETTMKQIVQWDLWGPLLFTMMLSTTTSIQTKQNTYVLIFTTFWLGAFVIYFNSKMLGCKLSLCSFWCLLGYSLVPFLLVSTVHAIFKLPFIVKVIINLIAGVWSVFVCMRFVRTKISNDKTFLITYPIGLFYTFYVALYTVI